MHFLSCILLCFIFSCAIFRSFWFTALCHLKQNSVCLCKLTEACREMFFMAISGVERVLFFCSFIYRKSVVCMFVVSTVRHNSCLWWISVCVPAAADFAMLWYPHTNTFFKCYVIKGAGWTLKWRRFFNLFCHLVGKIPCLLPVYTKKRIGFFSFKNLWKLWVQSNLQIENSNCI